MVVTVKRRAVVTLVRAAPGVRHGRQAAARDGYQGRSSLLTWAPPRQIPIYVAAHGRRSLTLGNEIGDGVVAGTSLAPKRVEQVLALIDEGARRSGRRAEDLDVWFFTHITVSTLGEEAMELAPLGSGRQVGAVRGSPSQAPLFPMPADVRERLTAGTAQGGADVSRHGTPDRSVLRRYAHAVREAGVRDHLLSRSVVGTPEQCVEQLTPCRRRRQEGVAAHARVPRPRVCRLPDDGLGRCPEQAAMTRARNVKPGAADLGKGDRRTGKFRANSTFPCTSAATRRISRAEDR